MVDGLRGLINPVRSRINPMFRLIWLLSKSSLTMVTPHGLFLPESHFLIIFYQKNPSLDKTCFSSRENMFGRFWNFYRKALLRTNTTCLVVKIYLVGNVTFPIQHIFGEAIETILQENGALHLNVIFPQETYV